MTVRTAELLMALLLLAFSVFLMIESAKLPIGWEEGVGPGGGAWPFWLATIMLGCCVLNIVRWFRRVTPESNSLDDFFDKESIGINAVTVISLFVFLFLTNIISLYLAMMLFLFFYIRIVGRHGFVLSALISFFTPIFLFIFFEAVLKIILPKGKVEFLYYPFYDYIY